MNERERALPMTAEEERLLALHVGRTANELLAALHLEGIRLDAARAGDEGLREAGRIAIEYVAAKEAEWATAKDQHETDDDLDPAWVAFRDAIKAAALRATDKEAE